jgi:hypothetical protein
MSFRILRQLTTEPCTLWRIVASGVDPPLTTSTASVTSSVRDLSPSRGVARC